MLDPRPSQLATRLFWPGLAFALACGLAGQALPALYPEVFAGDPFRQAPVLAAAHLTSLGFLGALFLGVGTQALPVLLHQDQGRVRAAAWGLRLFGAGVLGLVAFFFPGLRSWGLLLAAWTLLAAGSALLLKRAAALAGAGPVRTAAWPPLRAAWAYFAGLLVFGGLLAAGLLQPLLPRDPYATLILHLHWALWGFAANAVLGLLPKLLRLFKASTRYASWPGRAALGLIHSGLALHGLAWALQRSALRLPADALLLAAGLAFGLQVLLLLRAAKKPGLDSSLALQLAALLWLLAAAGLDLAAEAKASARLGEAAAYLGLLGFAGGAVLGTLQRIIAVLSWFDRFEQASATQLVPTAWELVDPRLAWAALALHTGGTACGLAACLGGEPALWRLSGLLLGLGLAATAALALASRRRGETRPFPGGVNPYLSAADSPRGQDASPAARAADPSPAPEPSGGA